MRFAAASPYARLVGTTLVLLAGASCHRSVPPTDEDAETRAYADSVRDRVAERERSSASQAVRFSDADRQRFTRVEHMIQARFTGVQVFQQGRGFAIRIRGASGFGSDANPLVIIDGASRTTGDLGSVSPKDVETIAIMKDAAAAIYGVRGANGVIVVTTRRGR